MNLRKKRKRETNAPGLDELLGIMVLITRFELTSRASLWSPVSWNNYIPTVKLGIITSMPKQRFDDL